MELSQRTIDFGIDAFGNEEQFDKWLNCSTPAMPNGVKNYSDEEIYNELGRIAYGIY